MSPSEFMKELLSRRTIYRPEAYVFVLQGMQYTQKKLEKPRHLTGQEFARSLAAFARHLYGALAKDVLAEWGIKKTIDFGHIVYDLIEMGQMSKRPEDSLEDFRDIYDFDDELGSGFDWSDEILAGLSRNSKQPE
ncbi:MAG TPA: hypothetical protein PKH07_07905 [bacterium]|nr:hypothetical protein [bacterium]